MTLAFHTLKPARKSRAGRRRIGRGNASGWGTYSTRGAKGQRARSGGRTGLKLKGMKRIVAAMPKTGGFVSHKRRPAELKLAALAAAFGEGVTVALRDLKAKGLVSNAARSAKVIGTAELTKKINLKGVGVTVAAKASIERAGGSVK